MKLKECLLLKFLYIKKYNSLKSYIRKQQTINTTIISTSTSIQILQTIPINLERYENVFSMRQLYHKKTYMSMIEYLIPHIKKIFYRRLLDILYIKF